MAVPKRGIGRCAYAFVLAISFDVAGVALLTWGLFGDVIYFDLLIYCGAILVFLSLVWWIFWYTGNIEVPLSEFDDDRKPGGFERLARTVSRRLSNRFGSQRGAAERAHGASTLPSSTAGRQNPPQARTRGTRGTQSARLLKYSAVPGEASAVSSSSSSAAAASPAGAASSMEMKPMIAPSSKKRGVSFQIRPITPRGSGAPSTFVDISTL
ncbi:transmembrane protein 238 [Lethenteron reissneri]|uniref:transmembrane protein 238 n=1 Tax=Lethenteron reissneri TaxID=7753 RepID=UPI002AB6E0A9|nr:transmembrane protein 238 [Lethenteron reissneri]XP_061425830.1 transmembrane protein 238 [Lethenteron reissneri]XP_061425831.1 transmembrane protein 238 [Lethenteron reissneri]XP_061425832.1 transmembrane protein 238 [Lethenteron reissneri]